MASPLRPFRSSQFQTQCEQCRLTMDLNRIGVCEQCRRILCHTHLHGSFVRRLLVDLGAAPVCVQCRARATTT